MVQPWAADINVKKIDVSRIPISVRHLDLKLKYWGENTLMKLAGSLGRPIKTDRAIAMKELLSFARVLVEIYIEEELPATINFENEWGEICHILLKYEWKPIKCKECGMFGHEIEDYKIGQPKRVWRTKPTTTRNGGTTTRPIQRPGKETTQDT